MIPIRKGTEPARLKRLRKAADSRGLSPEDAYATLKGPLKRDVRKKLTKEQGGLCAYCMCRIPRNDVGHNIAPIVIEHRIPRNPEDGRNVGQGLDYGNMLVVCHGNRGPHRSRTFADLTCDAHRKNTEFRKVNPCKPETLKTITYELDGKIDASDPDVRFDLVDTLNLNCASAPLTAERKAALDTLIEEIGLVPDGEILSYCRDALQVFEEQTTSKTPYVGILVWYLRSMIEALK